MKSINLTSIIKLVLSLTLMIGTATISFVVVRKYVHSDNIRYYEVTENLLDSLYEWNPSFMEDAMESDTYYLYEKQREKYYDIVDDTVEGDD